MEVWICVRIWICGGLDMCEDLDMWRSGYVVVLICKDLGM